MWVMSNLVSVRLETVLVAVQDGCMVCAKYTIGAGIILEETYGTPRYEAQVEACFCLFGDSSNLDER